MMFFATRDTIGKLLKASGWAKVHLFSCLDQYLGETSFDNKGLPFAFVLPSSSCHLPRRQRALTTSLGR